MNQRFAQLLRERYPVYRAQYPGEGRRKWQLRVLQELWNTQGEYGPGDGQETSSDVDFMDDSDLLDLTLDCEDLGILVRTDYSNDDAWNTFYAKFQDAENEVLDAMKPEDSTSQGEGEASSSDTKVQAGTLSQEGDEDSDASSDSIPSSIIKVLNAEAVQDRMALNGISNLAALRLLNDVDIRPSPSLPAGTKRISPPNRLIDQGGLQEVYSGKNIWIYDARSNVDECVRVVNQAGDFYGTATADSWRSRGTHISELQFNISYLGMKIDFGGLDRWDYDERQRNLNEANIPIV